MAYDPLTRTTRRTRTILIAVSAASLVTTIFRVQINNIPFNAIDIGVEQGLVRTVLLLAVLFNLLYFLIYFIDDIIYLKKPDVLSNDNTDIRNQMNNLDQFVQEAVVSQELKQNQDHFATGGMDKYNATQQRLKDVRQEVYARILEPTRSLHWFSRARIFIAEGLVPTVMAVLACYAAIQPALPSGLQSETVTALINAVRTLSSAIGGDPLDGTQFSPMSAP